MSSLYHFSVDVSCVGQSPNIQWGSMLHGLLMECLPAPWPDDLHKDELRPFSQWIEVKSADRFIWHITSLRDELSEVIDNLFRGKKEFTMKHNGAKIMVGEIRKRQCSLVEYLNSFFLAPEACPGLVMTFRTPTTHKSSGQYVMFPSVELIAGNLRKKLCAIAPDFALSNDAAFEQVLKNTRIQRYKLESARFQLEGTGVIGYTGRIELRFFGADPLCRLAGALFAFAEWSGVGIKTALGMGGCEVSIREGTEVK